MKPMFPLLLALCAALTGGAARSQPAPPAAPAAAASAPSTVRVPYVPEFVRKELKEEIRSELAAQAWREGWAGPGTVPAWVRSLKFDGDLRTRYQFDNYDENNNPNVVNVGASNAARDIVFLNTTDDRQRLRVRARLGLIATADENWSAGLRLTTGSTSDPVSSNQTLGNYGNRFTTAFDRAYIRFSGGDEVNAVFGRFGNPWFSTDLVWANDLGFDGVALQWTPRLGGSTRGFVTAAAIPVQEVELSRNDKWLYGLQVGADFGSGGVVRGKVGLAYYVYRYINGEPSPAGSKVNEWTAPAFAQKGNTYFNISSDSTKPLLALAADYRIVNLTGQLGIEAPAAKHFVFTGDYAKNVGYDSAAVAARFQDIEAQTVAWGLRAAFGDLDVHARHEWQVFFAYKHVERDAVLDAFTDSDLHLGGTDTKGYVLGASYGLGRNTAATLRWLSADTIAGAPFKVDSLQFDLSIRF